MKRVALRGNWDTPPAPVHRKYEVEDAHVIIHSLSLDEPFSPGRVPLTLQTTLDEWMGGRDKVRPGKDISPTLSKAVQAKALQTSVRESVLRRRRVGLAISGEGDEHKDPNKQAPEHCARIAAIIKLLDSRKDLSVFLDNVCDAPRAATDEELMTVHTKSYLNKLKRLVSSNSSSCSSGNHKECDRAINAAAIEEFDSIYMTTKSMEAARYSAGAALQCVDAVCKGRFHAAAAAIRPPGHHAEAHCAMGFCFFNNAALTAKRALALGLKRILIVDQDIHHGNGTQRAFWDDDRVVYFSVHRWDKGRFYPHNETDSAPSCVGPEGSLAAGKTVNVAFCDGEMGDAEYRAVWESILLPLAREFSPELIIISAGFDAAEGDPIGKYHVSPACFGAMTASLTDQVPSAKVVMLLEGGYNTAVTASAFCECVKGLTFSVNPLKEMMWPECKASVKPQAVDAINATIAHQSKYWKSLLPVTLSTVDDGHTVVPA